MTAPAFALRTSRAAARSAIEICRMARARGLCRASALGAFNRRGPESVRAGDAGSASVQPNRPHEASERDVAGSWHVARFSTIRPSRGCKNHPRPPRCMPSRLPRAATSDRLWPGRSAAQAIQTLPPFMETGALLRKAREARAATPPRGSSRRWPFRRPLRQNSTYSRARPPGCLSHPRGLSASRLRAFRCTLSATPRP